MLSYQAIIAPQRRQCERSCTTDSLSGRRLIQTFAKLPSRSPKMAAQISMKSLYSNRLPEHFPIAGQRPLDHMLHRIALFDHRPRTADHLLRQRRGGAPGAGGRLEWLRGVRSEEH